MKDPQDNPAVRDQRWLRFLPTAIRNKVQGRAYLQNVVSNTGWQFADHLVRMVVGLVVGIWVARYLGPEQFGLLSYALALVSLFAAFANLGLDDITIRDIVHDPSGREETLGSAFCLKLFGGVAAIAGALGTILLIRPMDSQSHWLVGIIAAGLVFQAFNVIEFWYNSQVQTKYVAFSRNLAFLVCSILKVGLIFANAPLNAFAWVALLEVAIGAASLTVLYQSHGNRLSKWRTGLARSKQLLSDGWPLILSNVATVIYLRIDQIMLGEMAGSEELGIYSVAVRLTDVWLFIPGAIFTSVFPAIVEARSTNEELFYQRLQKLYNLMVFCAYVVIIPIALLSNWLVDTLFGAEYTRAGGMLAVLIWANLFTTMEIARSSFLTSMNWTKIHFVTLLLGCFLNIGLNYVLIPIYGGMGAVIASVVSYWFAAHGTCFLFRPLRRTGMMLTRAVFYPKIW